MADQIAFGNEMSFAGYTRLFFTMIGTGIVAMLVMFGLALHSRDSHKDEKRLLAGVGLSAVGVAFAVNSACGFQHKKMRARGGIVSIEESRKWFYLFDIPMNLMVSALGLSTAYGIMNGTIPIHL